MTKKPTYEELLHRVSELQEKVNTYQKSESESEERELLFKSIFDQSFQFALILDTDGIVIRMNELCRKACGDLADNVVGSPCEEAGWWNRFADVKEKTTQAVKNVLKGNVATDEVVFLDKDRHIRNGIRIFSPIKNDRDEIIMISVIGLDITERKKIEDALKESEDRFWRMAENAPDVIYRMSLPSGTYEYVSPRSTTIFGYPPEDWYNKPVLIQEIIHPDWQPYFNKQWDNLLKGHVPESYEYQIIHKNGARKWIHQRNVGVWNDHGELTAIEGIVTDITERKDAEEAIRESEERFRQLFENMSSGVAVYEATENGEDFVFKDFNIAAEKIEHAKRDELLGRRVTEVFPGVKDFGLFEVFQRVWKTGTPEHHPVSLYIDDRHTGWRENYVYKLPSGEIVAIYDDVTESKGVENKLRESEDRLKTIIEGSQLAIGLVKTTGELIMVNQAFQKMMGYSSAELMALNFKQFTHPEDMERESILYQKLLEGKIDSYTIEKRNIRKDGSTFWLRAHITPVKDSQQKINHLIAIGEDITKTRHLEEQMKIAQKMESIGTLAAGIAHDFNNILSSIIGFTELALYDVEKGSPFEEYLHEVYTAGMRAKDLVWQILTFARQTDEPTKPIEVGAIAKEVLKFIRSTVPATIEIKQDIRSDSLAMGNPTQIHQIFMNLCTNAAQAMDEFGGTLEVALEDVSVKNPSVLFEKGLKPGDYVEISVSDTGAGIPPELLHSIFDPYFTTKGIGEGTGMGLAVVQGIVEKGDGKIIVERRPDKGTRFCVYLPVTKKRLVQQLPETEQLPSGTERILFVDDEAPIAEMGRKMLESLGYSVTIRTNSIDALELFRQKPDDFDLVITDMTMPNMTGDVLAVQLMAVRTDIPVILCTGYSKKISGDSAAEIGIRAFAFKPIVKADLAKTVRDVLDKIRS